MTAQQEVLEALQEAGLRDRQKVMVGRAPVKKNGTPPPDIRQRAWAEFDRIAAEHKPGPLEKAAQAELRAILKAVEYEL